MGNLAGNIDLKQVPNDAAATADQMGVGGDIGVKMLLPVDDAQRLDQSGVLELGEIPVDGAQTQVGVIGMELMVDPISSGVRCGAGETIINCLTLFSRMGKFPLTLA